VFFNCLLCVVHCLLYISQCGCILFNGYWLLFIAIVYCVLHVVCCLLCTAYPCLLWALLFLVSFGVVYGVFVLGIVFSWLYCTLPIDYCLWLFILVYRLLMDVYPSLFAD